MKPRHPDHSDITYRQESDTDRNQILRRQESDTTKIVGVGHTIDQISEDLRTHASSYIPSRWSSSRRGRDARLRLPRDEDGTHLLPTFTSPSRLGRDAVHSHASSKAKFRRATSSFLPQRRTTTPSGAVLRRRYARHSPSTAKFAGGSGARSPLAAEDGSFCKFTCFRTRNPRRRSFHFREPARGASRRFSSSERERRGEPRRSHSEEERVRLLLGRGP